MVGSFHNHTNFLNNWGFLLNYSVSIHTDWQRMAWWTMSWGLSVSTRRQEGILSRLSEEESLVQSAPQLDFSMPEPHQFLWFEAPSSLGLCYGSLGNYTHAGIFDLSKHTLSSSYWLVTYGRKETLKYSDSNSCITTTVAAGIWK